jgi:hypothetical protein
MYESASIASTERSLGRAWRCAGPVVARERGPGYDTGAQSTVSPLQEALGRCAEAMADLAAVDLDEEHVDVVAEAALALHRLGNQRDAASLALLADVERREGYRCDGAVTLASWLRHRTCMGDGATKTLLTAARRLPDFPRLAGLLAAGDISLAHVVAVTSAVTSWRAPVLAACEPALAELAQRARPSEVRTAVSRICDLADPDGSTTKKPVVDGEGRDLRRGLTLRTGLDGLGGLEATLDSVTRERLRVLLDALSTPDPPETPLEERRTAAQRQHDAFADLIARMFGLSDLPTVQGARPCLVVDADLLDLLAGSGIDVAAVAELAGLDLDALAAAGYDLRRPADDADAEAPSGSEATSGSEADAEADADAEVEAEAEAEVDVEPDADRAPRADGPAAEPAVGSLGFGPAGWDEEAALLQGTARQLLQRPPPRLRYGSGIPVPEHDVARLFAEGASLVGVLTLGPWRVVNVGARFRTLPAWLRLVLHTRHWHCRGPDCDRPAAWTQAHHEDDWSATHVTDLNATIPLCLAHHMLITSGEWTARLDLVTGEVVWRSATGRVVVVPPPWVRARTPTAGNARPTG